MTNDDTRKFDELFDDKHHHADIAMGALAHQFVHLRRIQEAWSVYELMGEEEYKKHYQVPPVSNETANKAHKRILEAIAWVKRCKEADIK